MKPIDYSLPYSDWSKAQLKHEATSLFEMINKTCCYSVKDLRRFDSVCDALNKKGVAVSEEPELYFNDDSFTECEDE